ARRVPAWRGREAPGRSHEGGADPAHPDRQRPHRPCAPGPKATGSGTYGSAARRLPPAIGPLVHRLPSARPPERDVGMKGSMTAYAACALPGRPKVVTFMSLLPRISRIFWIQDD